MLRSYDTALEQRECGFDPVRVDIAVNVNAVLAALATWSAVRKLVHMDIVAAALERRGHESLVIRPVQVSPDGNNPWPRLRIEWCDEQNKTPRKCLRLV
jgi:hypothetical protein